MGPDERVSVGHYWTITHLLSGVQIQRPSLCFLSDFCVGVWSHYQVERSECEAHLQHIAGPMMLGEIQVTVRTIMMILFIHLNSLEGRQ